MISNRDGYITRILSLTMKIETIQTDNLSQLDVLINEVVEQRRVVDIKLSPIVFQEKILYTALVMFED